jgi:hypothetical protein
MLLPQLPLFLLLAAAGLAAAVGCAGTLLATPLLLPQVLVAVAAARAEAGAARAST